MTAVGTRHGGSRARAGDEIGTRTTRSPTRDQTMTRSRLGAPARCRRCIRARTSKRGDGRCSRHNGVMMPLDRHGGAPGTARADVGNVGARPTRSAASDRTTTRAQLGARSPPSSFWARVSRIGDGRCRRHRGVMMPVGTRHGSSRARANDEIRCTYDEVGGARSRNDVLVARPALAAVVMLGSIEQTRQWAVASVGTTRGAREGRARAGE